MMMMMIMDDGERMIINKNEDTGRWEGEISVQVQSKAMHGMTKQKFKRKKKLSRGRIMKCTSKNQCMKDHYVFLYVTFKCIR